MPRRVNSAAKLVCEAMQPSFSFDRVRHNISVHYKGVFRRIQYLQNGVSKIYVDFSDGSRLILVSIRPTNKPSTWSLQVTN